MSDPIDEFVTPYNGPDDIQALRDWAMSVECPLTSDRVVLDPLMGLLFRPHREAADALMRLATVHPEAVRILRDKLAACEAALARATEPDEDDNHEGDLAEAMEILARMIRVFADTVEPSTGGARPKKPWQPPAGFVGRKSVETDARFSKSGKNPSWSTMQGWEKNDPPKREHDPKTQEVYWPEEWVLRHYRDWNPRPSNGKS